MILPNLSDRLAEIEIQRLNNQVYVINFLTFAYIYYAVLEIVANERTDFHLIDNMKCLWEYLQHGKYRQ